MLTMLLFCDGKLCGLEDFEVANSFESFDSFPKLYKRVWKYGDLLPRWQQFLSVRVPPDRAPWPSVAKPARCSVDPEALRYESDRSKVGSCAEKLTSVLNVHLNVPGKC